jgi:predicted nuclease of predicted toxin-antitoxin system
MIWDYAKEHGLAIMSKDDDFRQRSQLEGQPPKVIWLRVGNVSTAHIARVIAANRNRIDAFLMDPDLSIMTAP